MKIKLRSAAFGSVTVALIFLATGAISIALAFGALVVGISFITLRSKNLHTESALVAAWPEVIDHLMSGIQSGLSLTESLAGLATRGPEILRPAFITFVHRSTVMVMSEKQLMN